MKISNFSNEPFSKKCRKWTRPSQGENGDSFQEQLMSKELKRVSLVTTAVDDDENGDRDSEGSAVEQQVVSSDYVICKDLSIAEVEISPFFFFGRA
jgi:hypothetical protein